MQAKLLFAIFIFSLTIISCRQEINSTSDQTAKPAAIAPNITSAEPQVQIFDGTGIVTKINLELVSIELNHEAIKGAMPAMQMEFYVSDKKMLENLKVGDKVDFILENNAGAERIVSVKKK